MTDQDADEWSGPVYSTRGTAVAYDCSVKEGVAEQAKPLADGVTFRVRFHVTCGAEATLNVDELGAKPLVKWQGDAWIPLAAGDVTQNQTEPVTWNQRSRKFELSIDPIDSRALFAAVATLHRYDPVEEDEAFAIYADVHLALEQFIKDYQGTKALRVTSGTVRKSLKQLNAALVGLLAAWDTADKRTKHQLYEALGEEPFSGVEPQPLTEATQPFGAWERGVYRVKKFREEAKRLIVSATALQEEYEEAGQERRGYDYPGLDELINRLAKIYTQRTCQPFNMSKNRGNATEFVNAVIKALPEDCRPTGGSIVQAVWRTVQAMRAVRK